MRTIWINVDHPPCPVCGKEVPRYSTDQPYTWQRRKLCSVKCRNENNAIICTKEYEHPPCNNCGRPVERREGESKNNWRQRSCCSDKCARARCSGGAIKSNLAKRADNTNHASARVAAFEALFVDKPFAAYDCDPGDGGALRIRHPETFISTRVAGWW